MIQDLIVYAVIGLTLSFIFFSFIKSLQVKKTNSGCGGCSGCEISKNKVACKN